MSRQEVCATCEYWSAHLPSLATGIRRPQGSDDRVGICQRFAPQIVSRASFHMSLFPEVHADRVCGDYSAAFEPDGDDGEEVGAEEADANVVPFGRAAA